MERILNYGDAIREATDQEMARDPGVFNMGIGIDDFRGFYGTLKGLAEKYGRDRVIGTPLSEDSMTGMAIGAAQGGMRPIHVHERMDFVLLAMNQLVNIAAKSRYMYGGAVNIPIVVRACVGRSWGQGAQHSQAFHSYFMHVPGIKVVAPTTPYDAKGCLIAAIRDENPVIYMEHRLLHKYKGHVPTEAYTMPFGKARILGEGSDVTIVGISFMAVEALILAQMKTQVPPPPAPDPQNIKVLAIVHAITLVIVIPTVVLIRRFLWKRFRSRGILAPFMYAIGCIIYWAGCESVAFFGLVIALLNHSFWPTIVAVAIALGFQILGFPRLSGLRPEGLGNKSG